MDDNNSISEIKSSEPIRDVCSDGVADLYPLPEGWVTFVCSPENIINAWTKLNQFPILFDDLYRGNLDLFSANLFRRDNIVLATGNYGICIIENVVPFRGCQIQLTFWDRRFKGRREECIQALKWLFSHFRLIRSTISVPYTVLYTIKFIKSLGFKEEGTIRKDYLVNGRFYDTINFGLLKEELFMEVS